MEQHPFIASDSSEALSKKARLGFMWVGQAGRYIMDYLGNTGAADIQIIADPFLERRKTALFKAPAARSASGLTALLQTDTDGVVIATPTAMHAAQAISALRSGKSVFCLAPLAVTSCQVEDVVAEARAANKLLCMDLPLRHSSAIMELRKMVLAGEIGVVYQVELISHRAFGPEKAWYYDPIMAGGGCLMWDGLYLLDIALWCMNYPLAAACSCILKAEGMEIKCPAEVVEDYASAIAELENGTRILLECSWANNEVEQEIFKIAFHGTRGVLEVKAVPDSRTDFLLNMENEHCPYTRLFSGDIWQGKAACAWAARLASDNRFDPSNEEYIALAVLLDELYARR